MRAYSNRQAHFPGVSQTRDANPAMEMGPASAPPIERWPMSLNARIEPQKRRSRGNLKGCHYEVSLTRPLEGSMKRGLAARLNVTPCCVAVNIRSGVGIPSQRSSRPM